MVTYLLRFVQDCITEAFYTSTQFVLFILTFATNVRKNSTANNNTIWSYLFEQLIDPARSPVTNFYCDHYPQVNAYNWPSVAFLYSRIEIKMLIMYLFRLTKAEMLRSFNVTFSSELYYLATSQGIVSQKKNNKPLLRNRHRSISRHLFVICNMQVNIYIWEFWL